MLHGSKHGRNQGLDEVLEIFSGVAMLSYKTLSMEKLIIIKIKMLEDSSKFRKTFRTNSWQKLGTF